MVMRRRAREDGGNALQHKHSDTHMTLKAVFQEKHFYMFLWANMGIRRTVKSYRKNNNFYILYTFFPKEHNYRKTLVFFYLVPIYPCFSIKWRKEAKIFESGSVLRETAAAWQASRLQCKSYRKLCIENLCLSKVLVFCHQHTQIVIIGVWLHWGKDPTEKWNIVLNHLLIWSINVYKQE